MSADYITYKAKLEHTLSTDWKLHSLEFHEWFCLMKYPILAEALVFHLGYDQYQNMYVVAKALRKK